MSPALVAMLGEAAMRAEYALGQARAAETAAAAALDRAREARVVAEFTLRAARSACDMVQQLQTGQVAA